MSILETEYNEKAYGKTRYDEGYDDIYMNGDYDYDRYDSDDDYAAGVDDAMDELLEKNRIVFGENEKTQPRNKYLLKENLLEILPTVYYMGGSDDSFFKNMNLSFNSLIHPSWLRLARVNITVCAKPVSRKKESYILLVI